LRQSNLFEYFEDKNFAEYLVVHDDKDAQKAQDICRYFEINSFILPDIRASYKDDLRSFQDEMYELLNHLREYYSCNKKKILILPLRTALNGIPNKKYFDKILLSFAQTLDINSLKDTLYHWGYTFADIVETKGEASFRGDIIDIYSIDSQNPIRISMFDDEIESIRYFDVTTQKSIKDEIEMVSIVPTLFALDEKEYNSIQRSIENIDSDSFVKDIHSLGFWKIARDTIFDKDTVFVQNMVDDIKDTYTFSEFEISEDIVLSKPIIPTATRYKDLDKPKDINPLLSAHKDKKIEILAKSDALIKQANITDTNYKVKECDSIINIISNDKLILSVNKVQIRKRKSKATIVLDELKPNDYVVHEDYGIAIFKGIEQATVLGSTRDFVVLKYQGEDRLLLPIENIDSIDRYIADGGSVAIVDKLGKSSFIKLKEKVKAKLLELAKDIVELAAKRSLLKAVKIDTSIADILKFQKDANFEYTEDQKNSIEEIFTDISSGNPMDRLLSGDVGFGKTEVAMNALFATVKSGYQALFIAPTTLLSNQHYHSIEDRFSPYGIRVAKLDRFVTAKAKKDILSRLMSGDIDIVVGTHTLLGLEAKNLALVVIDEEHKFGVKQKESLKEYRNNLHILSMSATPIPRTLNSALSQIKGMSQLLTAPSERIGVRTYVKEYNDKLIKEIVLRELRRNGQLFYVYNKIATIEDKKSELLEILPDLHILVLHSKISSTKTEKEIDAFERGEYDLLLSTTIIESGIHIPSVNSIIIDGANNFGMADLHQLRGRVGRGKREGFCYFLVEDKESLSESSAKRLIALENNSFLGSGSVLAYHDLEIRGGGNIVGEAQSGHIKGVGYNLYLKMLEDSINMLTNQGFESKQEVDNKLTVNAYISSELVSEDRVRLELYRRLSKCENINEVYEIEEEINDRFGKLDNITKQFLSIIIIKILALKKHIKSVSNYNQNITFTYNDDTKVSIKSESKDDDDLIDATLQYLRKGE
jgi:transcription-repair coupling factor (superfamily II helicase)